MYARGPKAWGQCQKCGRRARSAELVADGYWPNLRVHPTCRDSKHPQEQQVSMEDPVQVQNPAPQLDQSVVIADADVRWGENEADFVS